MIRELTPAEEDRLLTQEEVDDLPTGTRIMIKWSGGNGPHEHELTNIDGEAFVAMAAKEHWHLPGCAPDRVDFVGKRHYHTRVFLPPENKP